MKKNARQSKRPDNPFYDIEQTVSSTECTGLMPALPQNYEEQETLAELFPIHDAVPKKP